MELTLWFTNHERLIPTLAKFKKNPKTNEPILRKLIDRQEDGPTIKWTDRRKDRPSFIGSF